MAFPLHSSTFTVSLLLLCLAVQRSNGVEVIAWAFQSYAPRLTKANETVRFTWSGTHNVFQFDDEQAFIECDTDDGASLVCSSAVNECEITVGTGRFFFGCGIAAHCEDGEQKVEINADDANVSAGDEVDPFEIMAIAVGSIAGAALLFVLYRRSRGRSARSNTDSVPSKKSTPKWEPHRVLTDIDYSLSSGTQSAPTWGKISTRLKISTSAALNSRPVVSGEAVESGKSSQNWTPKVLRRKLRRFYVRQGEDRAEREIREIQRLIGNIGLDTFNSMLRKKYGEELSDGEPEEEDDDEEDLESKQEEVKMLIAQTKEAGEKVQPPRKSRPKKQVRNKKNILDSFEEEEAEQSLDLEAQKSEEYFEESVDRKPPKRPGILTIHRILGAKARPGAGKGPGTGEEEGATSGGGKGASSSKTSKPRKEVPTAEIRELLGGNS